jgi:glycosyltransferase involved in cell wall biosynthesis
MKISACMIVKNELQTLPDCIKTLVGYVDEIVIVDTGSTDGTQFLIQSYVDMHQNGTKVVYDQFQWCDDFSAARNYSMSKATGDWIFIVDADDRVVVEDWDQMRSVLSHPDGLLGEFDIVACKVVNLYGRNAARGSDLFQPRFLKTASKPVYIRAQHNQVTFPDLGRGPNILRAPFRIAHIGYGMLSKDKLNEKFARVARMGKTEIEKTPEDAFAWHNYANALRNLYIRGDKAILPEFMDALTKTMELAEANQRHLFIHAVCLKGWIHYREREFKQAEACADQALKEKRNYIDAILLKACVAADSERLDDAEFWCQQYLIQHKQYDYEDKFDYVVTEQLGRKADVYRILVSIEEHRAKTESLLLSKPTI